MRLRGERFFSRFSFTHPGLIRVLKTAAANFELPMPQRRNAFERLARLEGISDSQGRPIQRTDRDRTRAATLAMIARLSESPVVCSQEERRILELLFEIPLSSGFDALVVAPPASTAVPSQLDRNRSKDSIVIWAPQDPAWRTALAVAALEELHHRAIVVCAEGELPNVRARFVRPDHGASALERALAVIDLSVHDPGEALALARLGLPLAVAYLSGAYEMLDGVAVYRSWMQNDIELAALTALGLQAPRIIGAPARENPVPVEAPSDGPPVVLLGESASKAQQTYKNFVSTATEAKYTATVPKGAVLFNTHVATLVAALERSDASQAQSDAIRPSSSEPGRALAPRAFSITRNGRTGTDVVVIPRATGMLSN